MTRVQPEKHSSSRCSPALSKVTSTLTKRANRKTKTATNAQNTRHREGLKIKEVQRD